MWRRLALATAALTLAVLLFPLLPHQRLAERVLPVPSRVYGRPLVIGVGSGVSLEGVLAHLQRAGYQRTTGEVVPGSVRVESRRLEIGRRAFRYPDGEEPEGRVGVEFDGRGRVSSVAGPGGAELESLLLEPEVIATLFGPDGEDRWLVHLSDVPEHVIDAVLVTEDRRFRWHPGVDPVRIAGAALRNWRAGRIVEGGSTLTQQLVKNVYLWPERTWTRKLREIGRAVWTDLRYSKDEILEAYLNQIYLGQDGARGVHGLGSAARFYFASTVSELDVAEGALLAAMIRAPNALSPKRHPERARARRDQVLDRMLASGRIDAEIHAAARARPIALRSAPQSAPFAAHYVDWLRGRLRERFSEESLTRDGFDIFSSLDGDFQRAGEQAVSQELRRLEKSYPLLHRKRSPLQAALVALDPATGDVLALVGGRDYALSPFDRAARAKRQPGSVFKPFVALAAFTSEAQPPFTLATLLEDRPLRAMVEGEAWQPVNHDHKHRGAVSLRVALEDSLNVPLARLGMEVGLVHVAETARALGVKSPLRPIPSLSLGSFEMTPLEVATAYTVLASGGMRRPPRATLAVVAPDGRVRRGDPVDERRAFESTDIYLVNSALQGVTRRGTARGLAGLGVKDPVAGKTGTTNGFRDAWFVGYSPDLVVAVWVGFDDGARVGLTGARAALPIFARFWRDALGPGGGSDFEPPDDVRVVEIDPSTGLLASERCPGRSEVFEAGTAPTQPACPAPDWRSPFDWLLDRVGR